MTEQAKTVESRIEITKTVKEGKKNKRVFDRSEPITYFLLSSFYDAPDATIKEVELEDKTIGHEITYNEDATNWLYSAIRQKVVATANNRYRAGEKAPSSLAELIEKRETGSSFLADLKAFKDAIREYLTAEGKSDKFIAGIIHNLEPKVLESAKDAYQNAVATVINGFQEANDSDEHEAVIKRLAECLDSGEEAEDWTEA